jgi:myosin heavy subunit
LIFISNTNHITNWKQFNSNSQTMSQPLSNSFTIVIANDIINKHTNAMCKQLNILVDDLIDNYTCAIKEDIQNQLSGKVSKVSQVNMLYSQNDNTQEEQEQEQKEEDNSKSKKQQAIDATKKFIKDNTNEQKEQKEQEEETKEKKSKKQQAINTTKQFVKANTKQSIYLPFVGVPIPGKCEVLSSKYQLYAQCLNEPGDGEVVCAQCLKANLAEKNGTVHDRLKVPLTQYVAPSGKKPTNYGNVMNTRSYTMEDVLEYAKSQIGDIQIPEEHFKKNRIGNGNAEATIATKMPTIITQDDNMFNDIMNDCDDVIDDLNQQLTEEDKIKEKESESEEHEPVVEVNKTKAQEKAEKLAKKEQEKEHEPVVEVNKTKAQEKAEKLAKKEQEKANKEREKAEKLAKKEQEKANKERKKAEKLAKNEREKAEKLAKKEQEKAEKLAKKEPKKVTKNTDKEKAENPILGEVIGPLEPEIPSLTNNSPINSPIVSKKESEKNDVVEDGLTYITEIGQSVTDDYAGPIYMLCSKTNKVYNTTDTKDEVGTFDSTWNLIQFHKNKNVPIKELVETSEQNNSQTDFDDLGDDFDIDMDDEEDDDEGGF